MPIRTSTYKEPNYFLYIVGTLRGPHQPGDCGAGRTSIGSGICDALYGTMYIVPASYMHEKARTLYPHPETIKYFIQKYYLEE